MAVVKSEKRSGKGRPPVYSEPMVRGSFRIPTETLDILKRVSNGNVTRAIITLAKRWQETDKHVTD